jgi:hypothetical protein
VDEVAVVTGGEKRLALVCVEVEVEVAVVVVAKVLADVAGTDERMTLW